MLRLREKKQMPRTKKVIEAENKRDIMLERVTNLADKYADALTQTPTPYIMPKPIVVNVEVMQARLDMVNKILTLLEGVSVFEAQQILGATNACIGNMGYMNPG